MPRRNTCFCIDIRLIQGLRVLYLVMVQGQQGRVSPVIGSAKLTGRGL